MLSMGKRFLPGLLAISLAAAAGAAWLLPVSPNNAPGVPAAIDDGRHRGVIRMGVDYVAPPIGLSDYEVRWPEAFETVLADELSGALEARIELVAIHPDERVAAVQAGRVDVLLVPLAAQETLGATVETVDTGYRSGAMPLMRNDTAITAWGDLSGKVVCVAAGNAGARSAAERHGAFVHVLKAPAKSLAQTRIGYCDAAMHDEAVLRELIKQPNWEKFSATLPPSAPYRLAFVVNAGDRSSAKLLREIAGRWSSTGAWQVWKQKWAAEVAFEVYLEQDAPDCH